MGSHSHTWPQSNSSQVSQVPHGVAPPAQLSAVFFAIAQVFGALGPLFYGALIGDGTSRTGMVWGYVIGGLIMVVGGVVELLIGIKAEGQSLENVTKPLSASPADVAEVAE